MNIGTATSNPPEDLLSGAVQVEERSFNTIFGRVCKRLELAVQSLKNSPVPVPCPACRGQRCRHCSDGTRPFRYVYHDPRARLELGIEILLRRLYTAGNDELHWLLLSVDTLRGLRREKK